MPFQDYINYLRNTGLETCLSIAAYSTCSISMMLLNKLIIDVYKLNYAAALVFFQSLFALALVWFLRAIKWAEFPSLDRPLLVKWLPLTGLFVGMLATSLNGLRTMSISISLLIKNFALILIAVGDHYLYGHFIDRWVMLSFLLMIAGSIVGATEDPWVTPIGLFWSISNVLCTTGYQLYMKAVLNDLKKMLGKWGPVYYNNLLALPFLLVPTVTSYPEWSSSLAESTPRAQFWLVAMMLVGAVMTMASFWCMRMTSPTTYSVVGSLNKVPLALLGMHIFEQYPNRIGGIGIAGALSGGLLYTYANYLSQQSAKKADNASDGNFTVTVDPKSIPGEIQHRHIPK